MIILRISVLTIFLDTFTTESNVVNVIFAFHFFNAEKLSLRNGISYTVISYLILTLVKQLLFCEKLLFELVVVKNEKMQYKIQNVNNIYFQVVYVEVICGVISMICEVQLQIVTIITYLHIYYWKPNLFTFCILYCIIFVFYYTQFAFFFSFLYLLGRLQPPSPPPFLCFYGPE